MQVSKRDFFSLNQEMMQSFKICNPCAWIPETPDTSYQRCEVKSEEEVWPQLQLRLEVAAQTAILREIWAWEESTTRRHVWITFGSHPA